VLHRSRALFSAFSNSLAASFERIAEPVIGRAFARPVGDAARE
jgi:hypothetical protein